MKLIELRAVKETIDMKKGGLVIYDTQITTEKPGIILLNNPDGEYSVMIVNQLHPGGPVRVMVKALVQPAKKYVVNDIVGHLIEL